MPPTAVGWTIQEEEKLIDLVQPHTYLYQGCQVKNLLVREATWAQIAQRLSRPVEECKKRWRGLRDGYMRSKRNGSMHKSKVSIFEKLEFLDVKDMPNVMDEEVQEDSHDVISEQVITDNQEYYELEFLDDGEEVEAAPEPVDVKDVLAPTKPDQVVTDKQEFYQITVVDGPQQQQSIKPLIKIVPRVDLTQEPPKKIGRKNCGRKKSIPIPPNLQPIKILPKPMVMNNSPRIVKYVGDHNHSTKTPEQRSQTIDKLIEKVLKENTNEIDVFFRSMAASVKKLQPNLIPKVKMEVCNVIAKYEMQSFDGIGKNC